MAEARPEYDLPEIGTRRRPRLWPARWRWRLSLVALIALIGFATAIWLGRERIAGDLIDDALEANGIEARYDIASIGPNRQVIENLVIGDAQAPDFTAEQVIVEVELRLGTPRIGRVELVRPRLYGTYTGGELSFGALDPLVFGGSDAPAALPALDLAIRDGRALIESDYGAIGLKLEGAGRLDDGFTGRLAATAPGIGTADCRAEAATLYTVIETRGGRARLDGPIRLRELTCEGAQVASADIAAEIDFADDFSKVDAELGLASRGLAFETASIDRLRGEARMSLGLTTGPGGGLGNFALSHELDAMRVAGAGFSAASVSLDGAVRARGGFASGDWRADFEGEGTDYDLAAAETIRSARAAAEGTLADALLAKLERGASRAIGGGRFAGSLTLRSDGDNTSLIIPEARLRSGGGETILALSRVSYSSRGARLAGNVLTGGPDLPRINARVTQARGGGLRLRLAMAEYRAGGDSLAIPRLDLRRTASGRYTFNGMVEAEGAIPGGAVRGLVLPVEGRFSQGEGLVLGTRCAEARIAGLRYYEIGLDARSVTLCPADGSAMLTYRDRLSIAAASDDFDLSGTLADTPARFTARRAVLRYPGAFRIDGLDAVLGPADSAVRLSMNVLEGEFAEGVGGTFEGGRAGIDAVPLDLSDLGGRWRYEDSVLAIGEGAFTLTERTGPGLASEARFEPMIARGATLRLADNVITAAAPLRRREGGQVITEVALRHDLATGIGSADLDVPGVTFGDGLQPEDLSYLASGVIALAKGTVSGEGRIDWNGDDVTSSGILRSDGFDFAAAFGPVRGVSGEIVFTDLLSLTTAPGQTLQIASVNPGIEVLGGTVAFAMRDGQVIEVNEGRWPFMGGTLILRPTDINFGGTDGQSYVFEIVALDAATFVAQMELSNISATGTFDGTIPIFFDAEGNGFIRGGLLISRPPGGNVAYVGELTYEDLGTMANYAFQTLRSLDYSQMSIELNGSLAGEIITNFNIDGVRQGEGASRNILTRQLAEIPIRFRINVRSENFYLLATIVRGLFDPTVFGNPIDQGLLKVEDGRFVPSDPFSEPPPETPPEPVPPADETSDPPDAQRRDEPPVQPSESDELP